LPAKNLLNAPNAQDFIKRYQARFNLAPVNTSLVAYDAALVIIDAMKRLVAAGGPVTREAVRDAIASASVETLQGPVSFDANGDLNDRTITVYQFHRDPDHPLEDWTFQRRFVGVAPAADPGT
jgi:branched-chain amino acid transport system substrate-binding protein